MPKLRIEAPSARRVRSKTRIDFPRLAADQAWASPTIPAPTTMTSESAIVSLPAGEIEASTELKSNLEARPPPVRWSKINRGRAARELRLLGQRALSEPVDRFLVWA